MKNPYLNNTITELSIVKDIRERALFAQKEIVYESAEDEGAAEHHAELESVIDACDKLISGEEIDPQTVYDACEYVGFKKV